jgi:hypothetical protein
MGGMTIGCSPLRALPQSVLTNVAPTLAITLPAKDIAICDRNFEPS